MAATIGEFLERLEESDILEADALGVVRAKAGDRDAVAEEFVKRLHREGDLTAYQAKVLWKNQGSRLSLGNYVVEDELGRGGMGVVLKARHRRMQRNVAVKVLPAAMTKDADAIARFQREVVAAAQLTHTNIVGAHDADEVDGQHILVMEFVDGRDLSSVVKSNGPLSVEQAIDCVQQAARGLEYAHGRGVVHRDIKPANLLLDTEGTVKILDMGLARFSENAEVGTQAELTGTGTIMGTVDYMSPEQALSTRSADERSDVYSLGITLWYLLTGKPAYAGDSLMARMLAHERQPIPNLTDIRDDVPPTLQSVFERMVAKDPADRLQSMTEVVAALDSCHGDASETIVTASAGDSGSGRNLSGFLKSLDAEELADDVSPSRAKAATAAVTEQVERDVASQTVVSAPMSGTVKTGRRLSDTQPLVERLPTWAKDWRVLASAGGLLTLVLVVAMSIGGDDGERDEVVNADGPSAGQVERVIPASERSTAGSFALEFDGVDDFVDTGLMLDVSKPFTVEFVYVPAQTSRSAAILSSLHGASNRPPGFSLSQRSDSLFLARNWSDSEPRVEAHGTLNVGQRVHVAGVWDGQELTLYVDGHRHRTPGKTHPFPTVAAPSTLLIGAERRVEGEPNWFQSGVVDELRISRGVRYSTGYAPAGRLEPDADTIALYHFDEGSGDVLVDSSGNGHDGKIVGAKWVRMGDWATQPAEPEAEAIALDFDRINSRVEIPTLTYDGTHPITIEAWINCRPDGQGEQSVLGTRSDGHATNFGLYRGSHDSIQLDARTIGTKYPLYRKKAKNEHRGEWVHVAGVMENGRASIWLNGRRIGGTDGERWRLTSNRLPFAIGNGGADWQRGLQGRMRELRISRTPRYEKDFTPARRLEPDPDTLALYHFDEGSGDVLRDSSGNGHHGRIVGAKWVRVEQPSATVPVGNYALRFATNDRVELTSLSYDDGPYTMEAYVRPATVDFEPGGILEYRGPESRAKLTIIKNRSFSQSRIASGSFDAVSSETAVTPGVRYHVAATWDGRVGRLFVDGRLVASGFQNWGQAGLKYDHAWIGASVGGAITSFTGTLDELRVSNVARYEADFTPRPRHEPDEQAVALYHFDEGSGDVLRDSSGNGHHGKIVGAEWVRSKAVAPTPPPDYAPLATGEWVRVFDVDPPPGGEDGIQFEDGVLVLDDSSWATSRFSGRDMLLRAKVRYESGQNAGMRLRYRSNSENVGGWVHRASNFGLGRPANGGYESLGMTNLSDGSIPTDADGFVEIVLATIGDRIELYAGGRKLLNATTPEPLPGGLGLVAYKGRSTFKDVEVMVLDEPPSPAKGSALALDGVDDYVEIPPLPVGNGPCTVEMLVHAGRQTDPYAHLAAFGNDDQRFSMGPDDGGGFSFGRLEKGTLQSTYDVDTLDGTADGPTHVAGVWDGKALSLYFDGKLVSRGTKGTFPTKHRFSTKTTLGAVLGLEGGRETPKWFCRGTIDEVRISSVARYPGEFTPPTRHEPDAQTLALYHCDEGSGDVLKDSSGNGHHGKIVGAKWVRVRDSQASVGIPFPADGRFTEGGAVAVANRPNEFNAYPWISHDGLVLYWTREGPGSTSGIMQASRPSVDAPFEEPRLVLSGARLASVGPNGLELVCLAQPGVKTFSTASRRSLDEPFDPPEPIPAFAGRKDIKGSAISRNGRSLLVLAFDQGRSRILRSERDDSQGSWGEPHEVTLNGGGETFERISWPSLTPGGHLLFSYTDPDEVGLEWGAVADATEDPLQFENPRPLLRDGKRFVTRCGRYCAATGELFHTSHRAGSPPFDTLETHFVRVADAPPPAVAPFDDPRAKLHQAAWAKHLGEPVVTTNSIGMQLAVIPPGEFNMGEDDNIVDVTLTKPFRFAVHEVTQGQWKAVMDGSEPWKGQEHVIEGDNVPATFVTWADAVAFCRRLTEQGHAAGKLRNGWEYRLPTEAEWEYACRAGTTTKYSFGDDPSKLGEYAWFKDNAADLDEKYAHEGGTKRPNRWGLSDMHGNVWEWCSDWDSEELGGGRDPQGASTGSVRVYRGGGLINAAAACRSAMRDGRKPSLRYYYLGFRVVLSPTGDSLAKPAAASVGKLDEDAPPPAVAPFDAAAAKTHQAAWAKQLGEPAVTTNSIGMQLAVIPPGEFRMGEPTKAVDVTLTKPFRFAVHEVTQGQWMAVVGTEPWKGHDNVQEGVNVAATHVGWSDAAVFCRRLTEQDRAAGKLPDGWEYRLPTEAEWEWACRAGTTTKYSFGDDETELDNYAWYVSNTQAREAHARVVGSKKPNPWGLSDMHGNVWEWCSDWYGALPGGTDPTGPSEGSNRVDRGGCWVNPDWKCRSSFRNRRPPASLNDGVGFRPVLSPSAEALASPAVAPLPS